MGESRTHEPCSSPNVVGKGIQNGKLNGHGCRSEESLRQSVTVSLQSTVVVVPPPATSSTLSKPSTFSPPPPPPPPPNFKLRFPRRERADKRDSTHADGDQDEAFGLGQLERALDRSADTDDGHGRIFALPVDMQAQVTPLGLLDELTTRWPWCRCNDNGWWGACSVETCFTEEGVGAVQRWLETFNGVAGEGEEGHGVKEGVKLKVKQLLIWPRILKSSPGILVGIFGVRPGDHMVLRPIMVPS